MNIIDKLKKANLKGRGGACFPTYLKWESVLNAKAFKKYIICNAAEAELDFKKDKYILEHFLEDVLNGIKIALKTIPKSSAFIYLNKNYYPIFKERIKEEKITLIEGDNKYIGGEETALINFIEEKIAIPKKKPPYVSEKGLFNMPTLVNNVETFYYTSKIEKGEYQNERFYMVLGKGIDDHILELKSNTTIREILKEVKIPFPYYIQAGGVLGEILEEKDFDRVLECTGLMRVIAYSEDPYLVMEEWAEFLTNGNCDKCTPCREGTHRILEMVRKREIEKLEELFLALEKTSFCALGKGIPIPFRSLIKKICLK
ncbi:MAG: NADH-ubiquinone oxidoreductase-F iron-sulfur binding region domain-containing protein [Candidatus Paceibacterota bacterium]